MKADFRVPRERVYNTELEKGKEHVCGGNLGLRVLCRGICGTK